MNIKYNYALEYEGWVQSRQATDPDPSNEPRGVSGYTFALPGEPDFDQSIYFQNDKNKVVLRSFCPQIGVKVSGGYAYETEGEEQHTQFVSKPRRICEGHPMYAARVKLLGKPIFDSRNSTLLYNGFGIINPFNLEIRGDDFSISRRFFVDPENPTDHLEDIPLEQLTCYSMANTAFMGSARILELSGVLNPSAWRNRRQKCLEVELAEEQDKEIRDLNKIAALEKRIVELKKNDPNNRRTAQMSTEAMVKYPLNSKFALVNGVKVPVGPEWPQELWMGGWDADALSFYVKGTVFISLYRNPIEEVSVE